MSEEITNWYGFSFGLLQDDPDKVEAAKAYLAQGRDVRVWTRAGADYSRIEAWCLEHLGAVVPITTERGPGLIEFWGPAR